MILKKFFSFLRYYYLHVYYHTAEQKKKTLQRLNRKDAGEEARVEGFLLISLVLIPLKTMAFFTLILSEQTFYYFFNKLDYILFNHYKGPFTVGLLLIFIFGVVLTYFMCRYHVKYKDIPKILGKDYLSKFHIAIVAFFPFIVIWILVFVKMSLIRWVGL